MSEELMVVEWVVDDHGKYSQIVRPALPGELPDPVVTASMVNDERDRRLQLSFPFMGKMIQRDDVSLRRIQGAAQMAMTAVMSGVAHDSVEWVNGQPLRWITEDNTMLELSPFQTIQMGQAAAEVETRLIFAAKNLKGMDPIPKNFTDDIWWEEPQ